MDARIRTALVLKPMGAFSRRYYLMLIIFGALALWFFQAWAFMFQNGMIVTGLADWGSAGGVPWGLFIGAFIWWVGIAHGGIIISAAVRVFKLKIFKPVARLAELLTIGALSMAGMYILLHLGRVDRVVTSIIPAFPTTIHTSPLIWDVTVITLYFVMTGTYLLLSLRSDIYYLRNQLPKVLAPLYRLILLWYTPEEDKKVERMLWWLALAVIILAPLLLHGGVIPWLFALLPSMPGWYGGVQGPQFLTIALTSALGSVIILAYIFRKVYGWEEILTDRVFWGLGAALTLFALLFLWLQLQQIITGSFAPPVGVGESTHAKVNTPLFWIAIGLVIAAMVYLGAQMIFSSLFNLTRTLISGAAVVLACLLEKALFTVEGLMHPAFALYRGVPGTYWPSWVEVSSVIGTVSMVALFFLLVPKVIPVLEAKPEEEKE